MADDQGGAGGRAVTSGPSVREFAAPEVVLDAESGGGQRRVLVATKFQPPRLSPQLVRRQLPLDALRDGVDRRLAVVACPAGFGKTSLLATWYQDLSPVRPIAWLTLDKRDNDPVLLWSYILESLRRVCPEVVRAVIPPSERTNVVMELILPRLVNALGVAPGVTLVLDDFQVLTDGPARASLNWLVEQAPPNFQLVVASRKEPDLPLPTLRVHGDLLELRADDLRFTVEQGDEFLNDRQLLGISHEDVQLLVDRTQGWPAGLYLAALSLRRAQNRHDLIARFGATNRTVMDFLEKEVMDSHDEADREFLVQCAVLDSMCGSLCDEVLETQGSAHTLERLARNNLFVVPRDDDGDWYSFHPLFAQLLKVELGRRDAKAVALLHERAYEWHREHGHPGDAIDHALAAGRYEAAADMVASCWVEYVSAGREAAVQDWLDVLQRQPTLANDPRLLLAEGWIEWMNGLHASIPGTIARIEEQLASSPDAESFRADVEAGLAVLKATLPQDRSDLDEQLGVRAVEMIPRGSVWRPVACWARALGAYGRGRLVEADRWFAECVELAPGTGHLLVGCSSLGYRSLIAGELGDIRAQVERADEASAFMRRYGLEDVGVDAWHAVGVALAAQGKMSESREALQRAVQVARFRGQALLVARALSSYATVCRALGDLDDAARAEAEAKSIAEETPDLRRLVARALGHGLGRRSRTEAQGGDLTERELTILEFLTTDLSEAEIARELFVSHSTVHSHTRAIYRKLGVSSRTDALARAREAGLLPA